MGVDASQSPDDLDQPQVGFAPPMGSSLDDDIPPPKADYYAPPPYELATKLPTYEEVQREKQIEGQVNPLAEATPPAAIRVRLFLLILPHSLYS